MDIFMAYYGNTVRLVAKWIVRLFAVAIFIAFAIPVGYWIYDELHISKVAIGLISAFLFAFFVIFYIARISDNLSDLSKSVKELEKKIDSLSNNRH